jgi:hypothetical protein
MAMDGHHDDQHEASSTSHSPRERCIREVPRVGTGIASAAEPENPYILRKPSNLRGG